MALLHVIGQIVGGIGFPPKSLFCKWVVQTGDAWRLLSGLMEGQTQVDVPGGGEMAVWNHPVELHYQTLTIGGWPKILLQVWHKDESGRCEFLGNGFCHVPCSPGQHRVRCVTWRQKQSNSGVPRFQLHTRPWGPWSWTSVSSWEALNILFECYQSVVVFSTMFVLY